MKLTLAASAILALTLTGTAHAQQPAAPSRASDISCRVLLPEQRIDGDRGYDISIEEVTVPANHDGFRHQHGTVEYFRVLSGTGTLSVDGRPDTPLSPGTVVVIPAHTTHQQHNDSDTQPLVFSATFIGLHQPHTVTAYQGEPDRPHGCPHRITPR